MDLIKTVRGLDENGPGEDGGNLRTLWNNLAASADSQFHAAEESTLRWLLKLMNGSTPAAETMRRYPLCWTILEYIFRRMPLFSMAKSLAFRKFIAVLQQTVENLAEDHEHETSTGPGKRKRDSTSFDLPALRTADSRLEGAQSMFKALQALLRRLEDTARTSSHDRIGAEHVRSLFCMTAAEAIRIVRPLFVMCDLALSAGRTGQLDGSESWIKTIDSIWDLHLQDDGDATGIAKHLLGDTLLLLNRLEDPTAQDPPHELVTRHWTSDIRSFLQKNLTQRAKAVYVSQQSQEILTQAVNSNQTRLGLIAPALYSVVSSSTATSEIRRRRGEREWMESAFQIVEQAIRVIPGREPLLKRMLERVAEKSLPVKVDHLRTICEEYALKNETQWDIIALIVNCDPDVFQVTDDGQRLLKAVCDKMLPGAGSGDQHLDSMIAVVDGILRGFRTSRDIPGFLKLWYGQMSLHKESAATLLSPWFHVGLSKAGPSLEACIERQISAAQLLDVFEWVVATGVQSQALSVFLAGVSTGIESDAFADAVCIKFFELSRQIHDSKSWATALRWRTYSRSLAWLPHDKRAEAWDSIKKSLRKTMEKSDLQSADCFEAFKCCCQAWTSLGADNSRLSEVHQLLDAVTKRLLADVTASGLPATSMSAPNSMDTDYDPRQGPRLANYVAWYCRGPSRLAHFKVGEPAKALVLEVATQASNKLPVAGQKAWQAIVENDQMWQDTVTASEMASRVIAELHNSVKKEPQPFLWSRRWIQLLSNIPSDALTRQQRETAMATLVAQAKATREAELKKLELDDWQCYLSLVLKLTVRPTFYDGMQFEDLMITIDALSGYLAHLEADDETYLQMIARTTDIANAIFRQMVDNIDERSLKYLSDGTMLSAGITEQVAALEDTSSSLATLPLRLTLMKCLISQLSQAPGSRNHQALDNLCTQTRQSLSTLIAGLVNRWVNVKSSRRENGTIFALHAALDAAHSLNEDVDLSLLKSSKLRKLDANSFETMAQGDLRGWTIQIFLRTYLPASVGQPLPDVLPPLDKIPVNLREGVMTRMMEAVTKNQSLAQKLEYVSKLIDNVQFGSEGQPGQVMAIDRVVRQMIGVGTSGTQEDSSVFAMLYGELIRCLPRLSSRADAIRLCRVLQQLLETSPQALGQWNIELTLESLCDLSSQRDASSALPYTSLCKLVEVIIKKHRLRLEGHYHILTTLLQALLSDLIATANTAESKGPKAQAVLAHAYGRVLTLICEPTAGAVSRAQQHGSLSSATDAAKRSAGKHMYLVLMQYVKLQLEGGVARPVREALEPAMNSVFDITSPEGRKILNDSMNASGRAILREMFKRYTKFGKWSGV